MIPFEVQDGTRVVHSNLDIELHNFASLVPGMVGNALDLQGQGEYLTMGDQRHNCLGNLEHCKNGITIIMYLKPKRMIENGYFLSAGPYSMWYRNGKTHVQFRTATKTWTLSTDEIRPDRWQRVDLSWDEKEGLSIYVDKRQVASTTNYRTHGERVIGDYMVYLGRPNEDTDGVYADVDIDEMEVWYANRDHLQAFGLLDGGE